MIGENSWGFRYVCCSFRENNKFRPGLSMKNVESLDKLISLLMQVMLSLIMNVGKKPLCALQFALTLCNLREKTLTETDIKVYFSDDEWRRGWALGVRLGEVGWHLLSWTVSDSHTCLTSLHCFLWRDKEELPIWHHENYCDPVAIASFLFLSVWNAQLSPKRCLSGFASLDKSSRCGKDVEGSERI